MLTVTLVLYLNLCDINDDMSSLRFYLYEAHNPKPVQLMPKLI